MNQTLWTKVSMGMVILWATTYGIDAILAGKIVRGGLSIVSALLLVTGGLLALRKHTE